MPNILWSLLILLFSLLTHSPADCTPYEYNPHVNQERWNELKPYFFPEDSPEKETLDRIFSKRRVLNSEESMRKSHFLIISPTEKIIVARHHKLRGYLIKAYLDTSKEGDESRWWKKRIDGARLIQESIERHGYQEIMKVPKKWIYPLPAEPSPKKGRRHRNFILIVEDVFPLNQQKNRKAYKHQMTPRLLDAFYVILKENFLIDSIYVDNAPFCKDGKIVFLDTEHADDHTRPVAFSYVGGSLSSEMKAYWEQLLNRYGQQ